MSEVVSAQKQDSSHVLEENYGLFDSLCSAGRVFELQNGVERNIQISTMPELNCMIYLCGRIHPRETCWSNKTREKQDVHGTTCQIFPVILCCGWHTGLFHVSLIQFHCKYDILDTRHIGQNYLCERVKSSWCQVLCGWRRASLLYLDFR